MSDDILHNLRKKNQNAKYCNEIFNETLILIEDKCVKLCMKKLNQLGLSSPNRKFKRSLVNVKYDIIELQKYVFERELNPLE